MSCGSSWTVMRWSKFVCVSGRVDGVLLLDLNNLNTSRVLRADNLQIKGHTTAVVAIGLHLWRLVITVRVRTRLTRRREL